MKKMLAFVMASIIVTVTGGVVLASGETGKALYMEVYNCGLETALAAEASGIPMTISIAALKENKSVCEYMNNTVSAVQGLECAVPVSQGGWHYQWGTGRADTFFVQEVLSGYTDSVKVQTASLSEMALNVARSNVFV